MDPVRNPYAPGAGQRPPELAGRDRELAQFGVVLERIATGRPERSLVLTGLRGVGKTVLLNALRSEAIGRAWATGKVEARADTPIRRPVATAVYAAVREIGVRHRGEERVHRFLQVLKAFSLKASPDGSWQIGVDVDPARGRADSGDLEIDLTELFLDAADIARDLGVGVALFVDELQDVGAADLAALCGAVHEVGQQGAPLVIVGAGLPHLPTVLSSSKSYAERLFRYLAIDRLDRSAADLALTAPAEREGVAYTAAALDLLYRESGGYPYFIQAYGKATWDAAVATPVTVEDVAAGLPQAQGELAVGFFGSRFERATPAERAYLQAMAELVPDDDGAVSTAAVARHLGKRVSSLSVAREALIRKGLVYSGERGLIAFTVPHFARFLRGRPGAAQ
jgi:hypothetical protein